MTLPQRMHVYQFNAELCRDKQDSSQQANQDSCRLLALTVLVNFEDLS